MAESRAKSGKAAGPGEPLAVQGEIGFDEGGIEAEGQQGREVRQGVEAVGNAGRLQTRPPDLEERAGGSQHKERKADGQTERGEDGEDRVCSAVAGNEVAEVSKRQRQPTATTGQSGIQQSKAGGG